MSYSSRDLREKLVGILCYLPSDDFVYDEYRFHQFFYMQKEKHPGLLEEAVFLNRIGERFSPWLAEAFQLAHISGVIVRKYGGFHVPDIFTLNLPPRLRKGIRDGLPSGLECIAREFQEEFSVQ